MKINYDRLPEHMQDGARLYIEHGVEPGSFLLAVLCNDFVGAVGKADHINQQYLLEWASWLYNDVPTVAWKSRANVAKWIEHCGLEGQSEAA